MPCPYAMVPRFVLTTCRTTRSRNLTPPTPTPKQTTAIERGSDKAAMSPVDSVLMFIDLWVMAET